MEGQLDRTIKDIFQEINQLNIESKIIEETDKHLPQNLQEYIITNNYKDQFLSLHSVLNCCNKIDNIKTFEVQLKNSLKECRDLFLSSEDKQCNISNKIKIKMFNDLLSSNKGEVESALQKIKFPIFDGFLLQPIIKKMKSDHENEISLLTIYFSIISHLPIQQPNIKYTILDEVSGLIHKKILASIIIPYKKSQYLPNQTNILTIGDLFDSIKSYFMKCLYNLNELLSLIDLQFNSAITPLIIMQFFIEKTFYLLNFTFNQSTHLQNLIEANVIELIQRTFLLNNELYKLYSYDVLQLQSFNNLINQIAKNNIDMIISNQKGFCDTIISSTLASKINKEIDDSRYNTEDVVNLIKLIIKDNMSIFSVFLDEKIIEENIIFSFKKIYLIFDAYFLNDYRDNLGEPRYIFLFNLLYSFLDLFNKYYAFLKKRVYSLNFPFKDKTNQHFMNYSKSLIELIDWYSNSLKKLFSFEEIMSLIKVETINIITKNQIESVFEKAEKRIKDLFDSIDKAKPMNQVQKLLITIIFKEYGIKLIEKLEALYIKGIKGKECDLLLIKIKGFINLFLNQDELTNNSLKGVENYIKDINKLLSNLNMLEN